MRRWWQKEVIRFECQPQCFKCCQKPGVVYFTEEDISRAAKYLNCSVDQFKFQYLVEKGRTWLIEVKENRPCSFLTFRGCRIHKLKPEQCRTYPFWEENLKSRNSWKQVEEFCPGIDLGSMFPVETIRKELKVFKR